jgi:hypothetical protein
MGSIEDGDIRGAEENKGEGGADSKGSRGDGEQ